MQLPVSRSENIRIQKSKWLLILPLHCAKCNLHFGYAYKKPQSKILEIAFSLIVVIANDEDSFCAWINSLL